VDKPDFFHSTCIQWTNQKPFTPVNCISLSSSIANLSNSSLYKDNFQWYDWLV